MGAYGDDLVFVACLEWLFEELQSLARPRWLHFAATEVDLEEVMSTASVKAFGYIGALDE